MNPPENPTTTTTENIIVENKVILGCDQLTSIIREQESTNTDNYVGWHYYEHTHNNNSCKEEYCSHVHEAFQLAMSKGYVEWMCHFIEIGDVEPYEFCVQSLPLESIKAYTFEQSISTLVFLVHNNPQAGLCLLDLLFKNNLVFQTSKHKVLMEVGHRGMFMHVKYMLDKYPELCSTSMITSFQMWKHAIRVNQFRLLSLYNEHRTQVATPRIVSELLRECFFTLGVVPCDVRQECVLFLLETFSSLIPLMKRLDCEQLLIDGLFRKHNSGYNVHLIRLFCNQILSSGCEQTEENRLTLRVYGRIMNLITRRNEIDLDLLTYCLSPEFRSIFYLHDTLHLQTDKQICEYIMARPLENIVDAKPINTQALHLLLNYKEGTVCMKDIVSLKSLFEV